MTTVFDRLYMAPEFAPVPESVLFATTDGPDEPMIVAEIDVYFDPVSGSPNVSKGGQWRTTDRAVAEVYCAERDRLLGMLAGLAPDLHMAVPAATHRPRRTERLRRLLGNAVRAGDRPNNPYGGEILDLEHWLDRADAAFSPAVDDDRTGVLLDARFLPALVEWLRLDATATGVRRRMIRLDGGLPLGDLSGVTTALAAAFREPGLAAYRQAARVVLPARPPVANLVFAEHRDGVRPVAVGLLFPPLDEYPLRLADGSLVRLPRPPWEYGRILEP
ncbi:hypothetical protein M1L60_39985 [Actinoplanes sp. TRM 88003]|uniref:Uncharacterized protein n=1 Tax=Paractinoplanes aksuensis TaxID=2939490 RepID=A0ABT1E1R9_9ACTN|nr:hypothetical protein [Actinoplanes aksuensis]MCO8276778.1 hypothetical protein [Actinoplanes aksuensis]